ncbi:hypothetical protein FKM82_018182, partial [Ascaphus truei]
MSQVPVAEAQPSCEPTANFSTPEIVMFPKQVNTTDLLKLECSSKHGYPKPGRMDWIVSNSTGKYNIPHIPLIAQDEVSKMYNISSNISLLITENTKVTCELLSENNVISTVTEIGMDDLNPILPMKPSNDLIYISIVPAFLILIVGFIYLKWRMKKPTSV